MSRDVEQATKEGPFKQMRNQFIERSKCRLWYGFYKSIKEMLESEKKVFP